MRANRTGRGCARRTPWHPVLARMPDSLAGEPLRRDEGTTLGPEPLRPGLQEPAASAPRVVIVEDERILAFDLKDQLSQLGYDVVGVAAAGQVALGMISASCPDLVLMDIHLEGEMDGIETASRIPPGLGVAVIYLTAYSERRRWRGRAPRNPMGSW